MSKNKYRSVSLAVLAAGLTTPVFAQDTSPAADVAAPQGAKSTTGLEEIVVTARRREESLQNVPTSITALTPSDLENRRVVILEDIQNSTPNLRIRNGGGNSSAAIFSIRGQVNNEFIATLDQSVGLYVDELIWSRPIGVNANLLDLASVQVLKGPQGTLFGRNTTGGAIVLRTNDPDPSEFSGSVKLGYGRFDRREGAAVLNVPLAEGLAIRGAIQRVKADPQFKNTVGGPDQGNEDVWTGRVKLLVEPTDAIRFVATYDHYEMDQFALPWYSQFYDPNAIGASFAIALQQAGGRNPGPASAFVRGSGGHTTTNDSADYTRAKTDTASGILTVDLGDVTVKAIGGFRSIFHHTDQDLDGSPYVVLATRGQQSIDQYSGELQLIGKAFDNRLDYTIGGFLFRESGYDTSTALSIPPVNPGNPNYTSGDVRNTSRAAYAQISYKITDELSFTGGLRYSKDRKALTSFNGTGEGAGFQCSVPVALRVSPAVCQSIPLVTSADGISYTAGLDYRIDGNTMVYAKTSRGFRSGGFNLRASGAEALFSPFKPEKVTDYEVGLKAELLDNHVRFNIAAFYSDYKEVQRSQTVSIVNSQGGVSVISTVANAATARIIGGEAELTAVVTDEFQVNTSLGLTYPKYKEFTEPRVVNGQIIQFDRSGEDFAFVSKMSASAGAQYTTDLSFGRLLLRADYSYVSRLNFQPTVVPAAQPQRNKQGPVSLVNARASLTIRDNTDIAFYGKNILGKRYKTDSLDFSGDLGYASAIHAPRPTYGAEVIFRF
ncbi:MAG: TonB-dependent receptor [Sphingobium sp.]